MVLIVVDEIECVKEPRKLHHKINIKYTLKNQMDVPYFKYYYDSKKNTWTINNKTLQVRSNEDPFQYTILVIKDA